MAIGFRLASALWPLRFPGKVRLLNGLVPREGWQEARVFGYRMTLDLGDHIQRMILLGTYESEETGQALRWLKPGMTFLDIGANVGYFTLLAASRVGSSGRVIAIEPSPVAYARLEKVVSENSLPVALHRLGLSDQEGVSTLYLPPENRHNHSPTMVRYEGADRAVEVSVRRLDDCLAEWGTDTIDLLKIDVEGHELKVFNGAEGALTSGRIRAILCEFNDYWLRESGTSPAALHDRLTGLGFVDSGGTPRFSSGCCLNRFFVFHPTSSSTEARVSART